MAMELFPMDGMPLESKKKTDKIVIVKGKLYHNGWLYTPCNGGYMLDGYDGDLLNEYDDDGNLRLDYDGYGPYPRCTAINHLEIPREIDGKPVVAASSVAFGYNPIYPLKTIIIPDTLMDIASRAFERASFLRAHITVDTKNPKYTVVDGNLCSKDGKILFLGMGKGEPGDVFQVPDGISTIGSYALYSGDYSGVIIPTSINRIEEYALPEDKPGKKFKCEKVYYRGTKKEWKKIRNFTRGRKTVYFYSETPGKYTWHFAPDGVTPKITSTK